MRQIPPVAFKSVTTPERMAEEAHLQGAPMTHGSLILPLPPKNAKVDPC